MSEHTAYHSPVSLAEHKSRRVRAGSPPPPTSERAELRAASKHGPYSYGKPAPDRIVITDEMREDVMSRLKAGEPKASREERFFLACVLAGFAIGFSALIWLARG